MKTIRNILWSGSRASRRVIHEQLELPLPGTRLTRDECRGLAELRRLRDELLARPDR